MKKLLEIALFLLMITSCITPYQLTTSTVSFEKYNKAGFLITTSSIGGEYKSLGLVDALCQEGTYRSVQSSSSKGNDPLYDLINSKANYRECSDEDMINELYKRAKELGANGIIDLKFYNYETKKSTVRCISGLAVKINQ